MLLFKKTSLIIFIITIIIISSFMLLNKIACFSVSPYGYINGYSSLPFSSNYCLKDNYTNINFITDNFGARLLTNNENKNSIKVFGDSQVLGLDVGQKSYHYLDRIHPKKNLIIFAAPNNGPYEVLNSLELNTLGNEKIIITFNSSTDIFRIRDSWSLYDYVSLDINKAKYFVSFPIIYDFFQWYKFATKEKNSELSNNNRMQSLFINYENKEILKNFETYFSNLKTLIDSKNLKYEYYLTHPYWLYDIADDELVINHSIYKKYEDLTKLINLSFPNIYFSNINKKNIDISELSLDQKHLRSNNFMFDLN